MSGCINCWETPCCCGLEYLSWGENRIQEHIEMLQDIIKLRDEIENFTFG